MLMARPNENEEVDAVLTEDSTDIAPLTATAKKDWTGTYTTDIKDQGRCGSCWAFSAVSQVESDAMRTLGKSETLSTQQVISCDKYDGGCNGGNTETAYRYLKGSKGAVKASAYPDTSHTNGKTGSCKSSALSSPVIKVTGYTAVKSETKMASYVGSTGPLSVCVDAERWSSYKSGILSNCGTQLDHCVQAVGIDTGAGYWKVRNSWGKSWGESGHIRLKYGQNTCGIAKDATYASVA
jgi:C1A family cysteine protease